MKKSRARRKAGIKMRNIGILFFKLPWPIIFSIKKCLSFQKFKRDTERIPMPTIKELIRETSVHERKIDIHTYPLDNDQVIVEGWLRDERMVPGYNRDGRPRAPGVVHWMGVRLLLGGKPITILDAEAEMPTIPNPLCPTVADSVKKIIGLPIVTGFSDQVRQKLYGVEGCSHLMHLILAMGPAGLHGYWADQGRKSHSVPRFFEEMPNLEYLVNSCQLWREDGPLIRQVRETLKKS
jgi:hypothetical protein